MLQRDLSGLTANMKTQKGMPKAVIFCRTKEKACQVYDFLKSAAPNKEMVGLYHASLTKETKAYTQEQFTKSNIRLLAATVAFGMVLTSFTVLKKIDVNFAGIDIPDIDWVLVLGMPDTISKFYQVRAYVKALYVAHIWAFICSCVVDAAVVGIQLEHTFCIIQNRSVVISQCLTIVSVVRTA